MITYLACIINHKRKQGYIIYGNGLQFAFQVSFCLGNFTVINIKNISSFVKYLNPWKERNCPKKLHAVVVSHQ